MAALENRGIAAADGFPVRPATAAAVADGAVSPGHVREIIAAMSVVPLE
ncbi:hypothetical protein [Fodinicola acaciae]|nr:hypothetical protein [Fodinicola acaciae]